MKASADIEYCHMTELTYDLICGSQLEKSVYLFSRNKEVLILEVCVVLHVCNLDVTLYAKLK